jgi:hypothetical protein
MQTIIIFRKESKFIGLQTTDHLKCESYVDLS